MGAHPTSATAGIGICRCLKEFLWGGVGLADFIARDEPVNRNAVLVYDGCVLPCFV